MADQSCPPLGTGSVDFNALHEAAAEGRDLSEALVAATTGAEPLPEPPSLEDRKLEELREIADAEGVDTTGLRSKADVTEAIEEHRAAAATPPVPVPHDPAGDAA